MDTLSERFERWMSERNLGSNSRQVAGMLAVMDEYQKEVEERFKKLEKRIDNIGMFP